jgi:cytochrome o ubiquinol oxidase subunit 1
VPDVAGEEAYWGHKQKEHEAQHLSAPEPDYKPIEVPCNTPTGFVCAFFAVVIGFAFIWHIWWMVGVGLVGTYATFVVFAWRDVAESEISAAEVARLDRANRSARSAALVRGLA